MPKKKPAKQAVKPIKQAEKEAIHLEQFRINRKEKNWERAFENGLQIALATHYENIYYLIEAGAKLSIKLKSEKNFSQAFEVEKSAADFIQLKADFVENQEKRLQLLIAEKAWLEKAIDSAEKCGKEIIIPSLNARIAKTIAMILEARKR